MNRRTLTTKRRPQPNDASAEVTQRAANAAAPASASLDGDKRRQLIEAEAYFLAERRGFTPGCELDDWLAAEAIVEDRLRTTNASGPSRQEGGRA